MTAYALLPDPCKEVVQGFLLGALSVLLVDGACRAPLLAAEPGLATLIKLCSRLPGYSQPWQGERRTLAARALCSCIQRDSHVRGSLIASGLPPCDSAQHNHFKVLVRLVTEQRLVVQATADQSGLVETQSRPLDLTLRASRSPEVTDAMSQTSFSTLSD